MIYKKLAEICTHILDCPHSTPKWLEEGIPVIRNYNLINGQIDQMNLSYVDEQTYLDRTKRGVPEEGDIIISREAPMGMVGIVPPDFRCCLGQRLVLLKVNKEICNPHYLLYVMMSDYVQSQIKKADATGSIVSNLNIPELKNIIIPIVNEDAQDRIAKLLSLMDQKIKNNQSINENMKKQLRLLYDYWFMQFDFPDEKGMPYRSSGGKMKKGELTGRLIPENWTESELLKVVSWNGGSQPPKSKHRNQYQEGYVRFIQNRDYAGNAHITYIPNSKNNKMCNEYDIMVDKYGDAGQTRYGIAGAYNVALSKIDVKLTNGQEYIRSFLESDAVKEYLSRACIASTRASLNKDNLSFIRVVIPEERIRKEFEIYGKRVINICLANYAENEKLNQLKAWILPLLINGQIGI